MKKPTIIYRDGIEIQLEMKLPLIDRIRLMFGAKLFINSQIATQWRIGEKQIKSTADIEKIFPKWRALIKAEFFPRKTELVTKNR